MFLDTPQEKLHVIADAVLRLSNYYIQYPEAETPWDEKFCQIAYRHYYLPLNILRNQKVIDRGLKVNFFKNLKTFVDWGAGPGTASLALASSLPLAKQIEKQIMYDISESALNNFSDLHSKLINLQKLNELNLTNLRQSKENCLVFSYSLTEVNELPVGWNQFEALMILEPSTSQDGRKLFDIRNTLIEKGYFIWAPCTHQKACPLLNHSKHDWCHDRASVDAPEWFLDLEKLLPMKNKTVTVSYLLARKTAPASELNDLARTTGDSLEEKGKTRQLVCRGEDREYLSWLHKKSSPQIIARGELVKIPTDVVVKANELRVSQTIEVLT